MVEARDLELIMEHPVDWEVFRNTTVLITGATGRLGMYFVEALAKADIDWNLNMTILAEARNEKKMKLVFGETLSLPNVKGIVQDICEPIEWETNVDFIIHTAGLASPRDFTEQPVETLWGHVNGTRQILEFARRKKTRKILYVSTVEVYGEWKTKQGITEDDMGIMRCDVARACYPEAKRLCETMLASYEKEYKVPYVVARLCHTFGPGITLDDGRAFSEFISDVIKGKDIVLKTDGRTERTYTYVTDAIGAMLLILTCGEERHYNVANLDNLISTRDLAALIASLDPKKSTKVLYSEESSKFQYLPFQLGIMNVDRVMNLGWRPHVGLRDAFAYTMGAFLQNTK